jgi:hypothetical protein
VWNQVRASNRYYKHTRPIFNPTRRLVDTYAGAVWPGVLTTDVKTLPANFHIAVPFPEETDQKLKDAIGQIWQWSNFSAQRYSLVRQCAALGNVLVEIIDDVESGKVLFDIVWPGHVKDLLLDHGGHVKAHVVEYRYYDAEDDKEHVYRREVSADSIRTYRDDSPFGYSGAPAAYANPYGFDPSVWVTHSNVGGIFGMPAARNLTKVDELNSLVSHANDQIHKILSAPIVLAIHNPDAPLPDSKEDPTPALEFGTIKERDVIDYIEANVGAQVQTINLPEGQALKHIETLLAEVERDHPELSMWQAMRNLNQVSGIAVERLFGDAAMYIFEAQANYDTSLKRMLQMAIAIAGMRNKEKADGWSEQNYQRKKFDGYDLESYKKGDLDFDILPRPIIAPTQMEAMQLKILEAQADRLEQEMQNPQTVQQNANPQAVNLPNGVYGRLARMGQGPAPQQASQAAQSPAQSPPKMG